VVRPHGCTDVSGFGLLSHVCEMSERSEAKLCFSTGEIAFLPGAQEYTGMWLFPAGTGHNQRTYAEGVDFAAGVDEETQQLLYTAETSGGLVAAVPPEQLDQLKAGFETANEPLWVIGQVLPGSGVEVVL